MATPNIVPRADSEGGLGTSSKYWAAAYIDAITTTGDVTVGSTYTTVYSNDGFTFTTNQDYNIASGSNKIIDLHFNEIKFYTADTK